MSNKIGIPHVYYLYVPCLNNCSAKCYKWHTACLILSLCACILQLSHVFRLWRRQWNQDLPLNVIRLWVDISADEENKMKILKQNHHHVYHLDNSWKIIHGHCGSQTPIWPLMWAKTCDNLNLPSITTLALWGMETMNHAIILDLGPLLLKVWDTLPDPEHGILMNFYSIQLSYLTHMSIQMYKRLLWESSICMVEREVR